MALYTYQPLIDIAAICAAHQINRAVLSPGSRCAPLVLAFSRHPDFQVFSVADERSAAFMALGMAEATQKTVVSVCTSGTAALNFAPAIAEAFYREVPMLVLTADRPPEWINQQDGQAIVQPQVYRNFVKQSYQLPDSYATEDQVWHLHRMVNEAILTANRHPRGPVHINVPIREPFYPTETDNLLINRTVKVIREYPAEYLLDQAALAALRANIRPKTLIIAGQAPYNQAVRNAIEQLPWPVAADLPANLHGLPHVYNLHDSFLMNPSLHDALMPDLVISFGQSLVSKNLKLLLRKNSQLQHWHIQPAGDAADTFKALTCIVREAPETALPKLAQGQLPNNAYLQAWQQAQDLANQKQTAFFAAPNGEFAAVRMLLQAIGNRAHLHLANSMSVRYASFVASLCHAEARVWANRGTSGIDGSTSTCVGHAIAQPNALHFFVTGDVSFFYDRNAFWHRYQPKNLRILLLNNQGGSIFKMIDGPAKLPEADDFFVTRQMHTAAHLAQEYGLDYQAVNSATEFARILPDFTSQRNNAMLVEFNCSTADSQTAFLAYKALMREA